MTIAVKFIFINYIAQVDLINNDFAERAVNLILKKNHRNKP